jgi:hypothetical protein
VRKFHKINYNLKTTDLYICRLFSGNTKKPVDQTDLFIHIWHLSWPSFIRWTPIHPDKISCWFHDFIQRTGLSEVTVHGLRHTFNVIILECDYGKNRFKNYLQQNHKNSLNRLTWLNQLVNIVSKYRSLAIYYHLFWTWFRGQITGPRRESSGSLCMVKWISKVKRRHDSRMHVW